MTKKFKTITISFFVVKQVIIIYIIIHMLFGKYINKYYKKYAFFLITGSLMLITASWITLYIPEFIAKIINIIDINPTLSPENIKEIILISILILAVGFGIMLCNIICRLTLFRMSNSIEADLRHTMFLKAEKLSTNFYSMHKIGDIISYFTNDLEVIEEQFGHGTTVFIDAIFATIFTAFKMFYLDWALTILAMIPLFLLVIWGLLVKKVMSEKWTSRQKVYDMLHSYTQENFTGIRVIKAFVRENREIFAFSKIAKKNSDAEISFAKLSTLFNICIGIISALCLCSIVGLGSWLVLATATGQSIYIFGKEMKLTTQMLLQFLGYFNVIVWPLIASGQIIAIVARSKSSLGRITNFLDEPIEIKDNENSIAPVNIKGKITYSNFSFKYPNNNIDAVHDINLTINAGETIGIIGKTGCGKTTLVNSLLRLYNINNNSIFIDNIDIMKIKIKSLREMIAYAPQDLFLFSDTVANNISLNDKKMSIKKIKEAATFSTIDKDIELFASKYDTVIGERGVSLSGGEKQRMTISRAFIKNPPIMILDDSVSAVDIKTEEIILSNIEKYRKGKTTILVSSRVSTVKKMDKIVVVNNGRIEAFGNHKTLLATSPTYARMVQLQKIEREMESYNERRKKR